MADSGSDGWDLVFSSFRVSFFCAGSSIICFPGFNMKSTRPSFKVFVEVNVSFSSGWFKKRLETFMKLSIWSMFTWVLPMYMNLLSKLRSSMLTPCRYTRGWGLGFCFSIFEKNSLHELRITLWACKLEPFSQARVTSVKSWSSNKIWKDRSLVELYPFHCRTMPLSSILSTDISFPFTLSSKPFLHSFIDQGQMKCQRANTAD